MIEFACGNCGHTIDVPPKYAGKRVRCPECGGRGQAPGPAGAEQGVPESKCQNFDLAVHEYAGALYAKTPHKSGKAISIFLSMVGTAFIALLGSTIYVGVSDFYPKTIDDPRFPQAKTFAENYIELLTKGEVEHAFKLLTPTLKSHTAKSDVENLAKIIGRGDIREVRFYDSYLAAGGDTQHFLLGYWLDYVGGGYTKLLMDAQDIGADLAIGFIMARGNSGDAAISVPEATTFEEFAELTSSGSFLVLSLATMGFFLVCGIFLCICRCVIYKHVGLNWWEEPILDDHDEWELSDFADLPDWMVRVAVVFGTLLVLGSICAIIISFV